MSSGSGKPPAAPRGTPAGASRPDSEGQGFDPKDAPFAMSKADEMEHVQEMHENAGESTAVTQQPATLLEPPPPRAVPPKAPREYAAWVPPAFALGGGLLALASVLLLGGSALSEASRLPRETILVRLGLRDGAQEAAAPKLADSVIDTPGSEPRAPRASELSTEEYSGFGLLVDSLPEGATVSTKGQALGETPLAQGEMECAWGEPLVLTITKAGYHPWSYEGSCRRDAMLYLTATLTKQ